ncbi:MAG TPA: hypothetical protein VET85_10430 [Stellaceae bacterium]|nr:hypothetical protein [Stellaceae bacterium]
MIYAGPERSLALPLGLVALALILALAVQTAELVLERTALADARAAQEQTIQDAKKLRQQMDEIAGETAELALNGNAAAKQVVDAMKREGVTLKPPQK